MPRQDMRIGDPMSPVDDVKPIDAVETMDYRLTQFVEGVRIGIPPHCGVLRVELLARGVRKALALTMSGLNDQQRLGHRRGRNEHFCDHSGYLGRARRRAGPGACLVVPGVSFHVNDPDF
jgi:hypothetical protein